MTIEVVPSPHLSSQQALVARVGSRRCAFSIQVVSETLRPLPIEPIAGAVAFVRGVSIIRGAPTPVLDLRAMLEGSAAAEAFERLVVLAFDGRRVAIGVDAVIGVHTLAGASADLPPLLREACGEHVEALATHDRELLVVLRASHIVPDDAWAQFASTEGGS